MKLHKVPGAKTGSSIHKLKYCHRPAVPHKWKLASGVFRNWTRGWTYKNNNGLRNVSPPAGRGVHPPWANDAFPPFFRCPPI